MKYESLEDEYSAIVAKEMQKEIDEAIMLDLLVDMGWVKVPFYYHSREHSIDVKLWMADNCQGNVNRLCGHYAFEDPKDAAWFILKFT